LSAATGAGAATPLMLLLLVFIADAVVGALPGVRPLLAAPLAAVRRLTGWLDSRLNRPQRDEATRRVRGLLVVGVIALVAGATGGAIHYAALRLPHGWLLEMAAVLALLGQRAHISRLRDISRCLALKETDDARRLARPLVRYDAAPLDGFGVARAAVEGGTRRFVESCIGSVVWYLLLGLPALCVYRAVGAVADVVGRPSPRHASFGFVARRLDDVLVLPAAILAGLVLAAAALFVPQARPGAAIAGWARDLAGRGVRHGFRAEGAVAGALGLALGGPRPFDGATLAGAWIGDGRGRATVTDVHRAALLVTIGSLLVAVGLALAILARLG
jgi:adenosylcobinamide-phosphate synthase